MILELLSDEELEALACSISVSDPHFREIWQEYESRGVGLIARVLQNVIFDSASEQETAFTE